MSSLIWNFGFLTFKNNFFQAWINWTIFLSSDTLGLFLILISLFGTISLKTPGTNKKISVCCIYMKNVWNCTNLWQTNRLYRTLGILVTYAMFIKFKLFIFSCTKISLVIWNSRFNYKSEYSCLIRFRSRA